jgi:hypothetical protein
MYAIKMDLREESEKKRTKFKFFMIGYMGGLSSRRKYVLNTTRERNY